MSPNSSSSSSNQKSGGHNDGNIMAKVSQKLGDLSLKKNRLLGEGFYERYSLPASRTQSYEVGASPSGNSNSGSTSGTQGNNVTNPNNSTASPTSPSHSKSFFNAPPVRKSPLGSPSIVPQQDKLSAVSNTSLNKSAVSGSTTSNATATSTPPPIKTRASASFLSSITPSRQISGELSTTSSEGGSNAPSISASPVSTTVTSQSQTQQSQQQQKHKAQFDFNDISRESSPDSSPNLSAFPSPDHNDPYARNRRPPQVVNPKEIAPRFVFSKKKRATLKTTAIDNHHSGSLKTVLGHTTYPHSGNNSGDESSGNNSSSGLHKSHGSMMELKRFFKPGSKKKDKSSKPSAPSSLRHTDSSATLDKSIPFMEEGFKKYGKLGRVLGSGAGGSVRLMKRSSDGTVFAVKEFRLRHANESEREYAKKVTAEFCIGSTLHHPNVIETLDIIHEEGRYFEVMEYCPYDFFAIVMSGKMSTNEIGCCFKQILSGVQYLHEMGLAHRDLKLDNCVVTEQGLIKLIDFGSSSVFRYPFEADIVLAHGVVGSDPYLAPEVLGRKEYDPRPADLWSIAIIFCCMTLRRFPWKAPHSNDNSFRLFSSKPDGPVGPNGEPLIPLEKKRNGASSSTSISGTGAATTSSTVTTTTVSSTVATTSSSSTPTGSATQGPPKTSSATHGPIITSKNNNEYINNIVDILHATDPTTNKNPNQPQQSVVGNAAASGENVTKRIVHSSVTTTTTSSSSSGNTKHEGPPPPPVIKGPWRLLRLLHHDSRPIIGRMLKIDPKKRATLEEIMADPWVQSLSMCTISKTGEFIKSTNHEHTFVPAEQAHLESYKK